MRLAFHEVAEESSQYELMIAEAKAADASADRRLARPKTGDDPDVLRQKAEAAAAEYARLKAEKPDFGARLTAKLDGAMETAVLNIVRYRRAFDKYVERRLPQLREQLQVLDASKGENPKLIEDADEVRHVVRSLEFRIEVLQKATTLNLITQGSGGAGTLVIASPEGFGRSSRFRDSDIYKLRESIERVKARLVEAGAVKANEINI
jgi:hypothetical protein